MTGVSIDTVDDEMSVHGDEAGTAPGDRRFRPDVEGLRAVAIVLVVLYHGGLNALSGGYVGVDVFFVISGFVITGLLLRERARQRSDLVLQLLRAPQPPHHPRRDARDRGDRHRHLLGLGGHLREPDGRRRPLDGGVLGQLPLLLGRDQLPRPDSAAFTVAQLLVARRRRAVLLGLPGPLPRPWRSSGARPRFGYGSVSAWSWSSPPRSPSRSSRRTRIPTVAYFSPFTRAWELALGALVAVATPWLLRAPRVLNGVLTWLGLGAIAFSRSPSAPTPPTPAPSWPFRSSGPRWSSPGDGRPEVGSRVGPRAPTVPLGGEDLLLALSLALADPDHRRRPGRQDEPPVPRERGLAAPRSGSLGGHLHVGREPHSPRSGLVSWTGTDRLGCRSHCRHLGRLHGCTQHRRS